MKVLAVFFVVIIFLMVTNDGKSFEEKITKAFDCFFKYP
jgi:hypothetical protein